MPCHALGGVVLPRIIDTRRQALLDAASPGSVVRFGRPSGVRIRESEKDGNFWVIRVIRVPRARLLDMATSE